MPRLFQSKHPKAAPTRTKTAMTASILDICILLLIFFPALTPATAIKHVVTLNGISSTTFQANPLLGQSFIQTVKSLLLAADSTWEGNIKGVVACRPGQNTSYTDAGTHICANDEKSSQQRERFLRRLVADGNNVEKNICDVHYRIVVLAKDAETTTMRALESQSFRAEGSFVSAFNTFSQRMSAATPNFDILNASVSHNISLEGISANTFNQNPILKETLLATMSALLQVTERRGGVLIESARSPTNISNLMEIQYKYESPSIANINQIVATIENVTAFQSAVSDFHLRSKYLQLVVSNASASAIPCDHQFRCRRGVGMLRCPWENVGKVDQCISCHEGYYLTPQDHSYPGRCYSFCDRYIGTWFCQMPWIFLLLIFPAGFFMVMLFYLLACGRYTQQGETDCGLDIWLANKFHKKIRLPFNYPIHYLASNADQEKTEETLKKVLVKNDPRLSVQAKRLYCFCAPLCCCCWAFCCSCCQRKTGDPLFFATRKFLKLLHEIISFGTGSPSGRDIVLLKPFVEAESSQLECTMSTMKYLIESGSTTESFTANMFVSLEEVVIFENTWHFFSTFFLEQCELATNISAIEHLPWVKQYVHTLQLHSKNEMILQRMFDFARSVSEWCPGVKKKIQLIAKQIINKKMDSLIVKMFVASFGSSISTHLEKKQFLLNLACLQDFKQTNNADVAVGDIVCKSYDECLCCGLYKEKEPCTGPVLFPILRYDSVEQGSELVKSYSISNSKFRIKGAGLDWFNEKDVTIVTRVNSKKSISQQQNLEICKILYNHMDPDLCDEKNDNRDEICRHAQNPLVSSWAKSLNKKYGIYELEEPIRPVYKSETCEVYLASKMVEEDVGTIPEDTLTETKVPIEDETNTPTPAKKKIKIKIALKFLKDKTNFVREKESRKLLSNAVTTHILSECEFHEVTEEKTSTAPSWRDVGVKEYCIAMPAADRSLSDVIYSEYIAGKNLIEVKSAATQIARGLRDMHEAELIHCDIKPRNILRTGLKWQIIDFDAAAKKGTKLDRSCKHSSGYVPPEMARLLFEKRSTRDAEEVSVSESKSGESKNAPPSSSLPELSTIAATPSYDVWSFGVVLYQLCTGESLFTLDLNSDNLTKEDEKKKLMEWTSMNVETFRSKIFRERRESSDISGDTVEDAQDLIAWCLEGKPEERPNMEEVLNHPFLKSDRTKGQRSMKHVQTKGFFLSHYPKTAGAGVEELEQSVDQVANLLYFPSSKFRLHVWLNNKYKNSLEDSWTARMKGIRECECFVLVLSDGVFSHDWCTKEINEAQRLGKKFMLINLTHPPSAAAPTFNDYKNQCRRVYDEDVVERIFAAPVLPFHSDPEFNIATANLLLKQAGYLQAVSQARAVHNAAKIWMDLTTHEARPDQPSSFTGNFANVVLQNSTFHQLSLDSVGSTPTKSRNIANIFIIGKEGYVKRLKKDLEKELPEETVITTILDNHSSADNATSDEVTIAAMNAASNCIFYATSESFKDDLVLELLSECEKRSVIIVREGDESKGGLTAKAVRTMATNELRHGSARRACTNVFGNEYPVGWNAIIPFDHQFEEFRQVAVKKVISRMRNYGTLAPPYLRSMLDDGIIPLPEKKNGGYHFFISKHEHLSKDFSLNVATALRDVGFKVWLSQVEQAKGNTANLEGMQKGVRDSDMILVIMTPGIFDKERVHVWQTEIQHAIELYKKPVVMIRGVGVDKNGRKISFGRKRSGCGHSAECCEGVPDTFQPIARALIAALEVGSWANAKFGREAAIKWLLFEYLNRQKRQQSLQLRLKNVEEKIGACDGTVLSASPHGPWYDFNFGDDNDTVGKKPDYVEESKIVEVEGVELKVEENKS